MESRSEEEEMKDVRPIKRITVQSMLESVLNLFNIRRGIGRTLWLLFRSPARLTEEYLGTGRYRVVPPFQLLLLATTLFSVFYIIGEENYSLFDNLIDGYFIQDDLSPEQEAQARSRALVLSPVLFGFFLGGGAFWLWLFHRRSPYNYAEILVFFCYWVAFVFFLFWILMVVSMLPLDDSFIAGVLMLGTLILWSVIHYSRGLQWLWVRKWWQNILLTLILLLLSWITIAIGFIPIMVWATWGIG
ncbi:MAG: DUF3667 domain-containing protein [Bacteroidota bacterium]